MAITSHLSRRRLKFAAPLLFCVCGLHAQTVSFFDVARDFPAGDVPNGVVSGDFNNDGRPDVAVILLDGDSLSVILNTGDGTFSAPSPVALAGCTSSVEIAAADFNGDGNLDLAVFCYVYRTQVVLLFGNGDGTFQPAQAIPAGDFGGGMAIGDFNNDGHPDLAVTMTTANSVAIFLNKGDGTFQSPVSYPVPAGPYPVVSGDFDGDGNPDLVVSSPFSALSFLRGNGDGTFQLAEPAGPNGPQTMKLGDVDQDGKLDLVGCWQPGLRIFFGNGDGTFQAGIDPSPRDQTANDMALADINQDGRLDILVAINDDRRIAYVYGDLVLALLNQGGRSFSGEAGAAAGGSVRGIAVADFNADGHPDAVTGNFDSNTISLLEGKGDGAFLKPPEVAGTPDLKGFAAADLNGDGKADLVTVDGYLGSLSVYVGIGAGKFEHPVSYPAGTLPRAVAVGDFNGDGKPDLVTGAERPNSVLVFPGNGDGTFNVPVVTQTRYDPGFLVGADFNGDGKLDLIVAAPKLTYVLLGKGDGTFLPAVQTGAAFAIPPVVADFNGDGIPDVAGEDYSSRSFLILLGNGDGTFTYSSSIPLPPGASAAAAAAAGDLNRDGKADLAVVWNYPSDPSTKFTIGVYLGDGNGAFGQGSLYTSGLLAFTAEFSLSIADLNGDGRPDVLMVNDVTDSAQVYPGDGTGQLLPAVPFAVGAYPRYISIADFNGDGRPDVATANRNSSNMTILINTTPK